MNSVLFRVLVLLVRLIQFNLAASLLTEATAGLLAVFQSDRPS